MVGRRRHARQTSKFACGLPSPAHRPRAEACSPRNAGRRIGAHARSPAPRPAALLCAHKHSRCRGQGHAKHCALEDASGRNAPSAWRHATSHAQHWAFNATSCKLDSPGRRANNEWFRAVAELREMLQQTNAALTVARSNAALTVARSRPSSQRTVSLADRLP